MIAIQCEIKLFHFLPLWSTQLTDFNYTDVTVIYRDALDSLRVLLNTISLTLQFHRSL